MSQLYMKQSFPRQLRSIFYILLMTAAAYEAAVFVALLIVEMYVIN
jgi:NADH:ubiquinone oxidoreductase subunit K